MAEKTVCKKCGKKFHYCGSCDPDGYSEYGYCTDVCMTKSNEYVQELNKIAVFINSCSTDSLKLLHTVLDDNYLMDEYKFEVCVRDELSARGK
jgi:hypothetical protein